MALASGGDVNEQDDEGVTPLLYVSRFECASQQEHLAFVELLLSYGANVNHQCNFGYAPWTRRSA